MENKIDNIVIEELENLLNELIDPNGGNTYYPQGLDPKVVKLFEKFKKDKQNEKN